MADGEQRFNPPPGWPPAPAGWRPPPGWTPPAEWPPAPPGWQLWLPATAPAVAPTPPATAPTPPAAAPTPPPVRPGALPWYRKTWGTLLLLVVFFPAGLFLMWRRQSWGRGVKWGLTAATAVFVAIALASGGSGPSSSVADHLTTPSTPVSSSAAPATRASVTSPVTTAVPPVTHSTVAPPATTKAPVVAPAPSTPHTSRPAPIIPSTTAPPPVQRTSAPAASCYPLTNGGNCYEPGEFCRKADHGAYGIAGNGERIVCAYNNGWRWEPV